VRYSSNVTRQSRIKFNPRQLKFATCEALGALTAKYSCLEEGLTTYALVKPNIHIRAAVTGPFVGLRANPPTLTAHSRNEPRLA
jgi:hypothetical protein